MKFSPALLFRLVLVPLLGAALFAGCCGAKTCDCQNNRADALLFNFRPGSFTAAELDTVILERSVFPRDPAIRTVSGTTYRTPDVAAIVRDRASLFRTPIVLDNAKPFAVDNGRKLGAPDSTRSYRYTITVREPARNGPILARYYINQITLRGQYDADGCCSCYRNEEKRFRVVSVIGSTSRDTLIDAHTAPGDSLRVTILRR